MSDVISSLAGIAEGSALAALRAERPESRDHAQGSYLALFSPKESTGLSGMERYAVALRVASRHASREGVAHYKAGLVKNGASPEIVVAAGNVLGGDTSLSTRLAALLAHTDLLSTHPVDTTTASHQALSDAGLSTAEILTLSQIVAFLSFQLRVIAALQVMGGGSGEAEPVIGPTESGNGKGAANIIIPEEPLNRPKVFTRDQLSWTPWLEPLNPEDATPSQAEALAGRPGNSPYFRLLALDADVLTERTKTDLGIFYTHGGAPRAERELAAAVTSRWNGCIFCASVHARTAANLSKREADVDRVLNYGVGAGIDLELDDRWSAVVDLALQIARTPSTVTTAHVERLRSLGLADLEILDIAQSAAFFSWANRLMLTIGEPFYA